MEAGNRGSKSQAERATEPPVPSTRLGGHGTRVMGLRFSGDGKVLASVGEDKTLKLWDVAILKPLDKVSSLKPDEFALSHDGKMLVEVFNDVLRLHHVDTGELEGWCQAAPISGSVPLRVTALCL